MVGGAGRFGGGQGRSSQLRAADGPAASAGEAPRRQPPLSEAVRAAVERASPGAPILRHAGTDLNLERHFAPGCVVLTARHLIVVEDARVRLSRDIRQIETLRTEEHRGTVSLLLGTSGDAARCIAWCTRAHAGGFEAVRQAFDGLRSGAPGATPVDAPGSDGRPHHAADRLNKRTLLRLLGLLRPHRVRVLWTMGLTALAVASRLAPPWITKLLIDEVILPRNAGPLPGLIGALIAVASLQWATRIASGSQMAWLGARVVADLRSRLHAAVQQIELRHLAGRESGEIIGRIMHDAASVQRFLVDGSSHLLVQLLSMGGIGVVLLRMDWRLALIAMLPVPLLLVGSRGFRRTIHPLFHRQGNRIAVLNSQLNESIRGLRTIRAFAREGERTQVFDRTSEGVFEVQVDLERKFLVFSESMQWIMALGVAAIWWVAAGRIVRGDALTLGTLTAFVGYLWQFYGPVQWLARVFNWMVGAVASAERMFALLDAPREPNPGARARALPSPLRGGIELESVHFSYAQGKEVLKGISLRIEPGERIGLVGRSGVGKSTLIQLICRFFEPDSGRILIDGIPLDKLDPRNYRRCIGMVPQDPFLFNASLFANIAWARPGAALKDVVQAARAANAHEFIVQSEDGYDTLVGEGGATLSGGERQRIAIARAILHDPPLLILDEATSSLDTQTEQAIQEALRRLCEGRTTLAIAHRLSTLRNANRLAVLDDGRVAECGTHEDLLAREGLYAQLVRAQTELNRIRTDAWNP